MLMLNLVLLLSSIADITLLYIGPEAFMPLLSFLAALGGFLLMFWRRIVAGIRKFFGYCRNLISDRTQ